MTVFHINPATGSDSTGTGTEALPWATFAPVSTGGWSGHEVRVARGTTMNVNSTTRANVEAAGGCLLTAYGDPLLPRPIISGEVGGSFNFNPVWLRLGADITVEQLHITRSLHNGLNVNPTTGNSLTRLKLRYLLLTETNQDGSPGKDALSIGAMWPDAGTVTDVEVDRVVCRDNNGHGIKVRGGASNVRVRNSVAIRSGLTSPSHGMGTCGFTLYFVSLTWTNVGSAGGGTIWERTISPAELENTFKSSITGWTGGSVNNGGPEALMLYPAGNPALPLPGEIGIGAVNTIRINIGALNPSTRRVVGAYLSPRSVWFTNCVTDDTFDSNGVEGQGMYFDEHSFDCWSLFCASRGNDGQGFYVHRSVNCGHYAGLGTNNGKAGAESALSNDVSFHSMKLLCRPGTPGVTLIAGCQGNTARRNIIVGATTGIVTDSLTLNEMAEDENRFLNCDARLSLVSSPGARSVDVTQLVGTDSINLWADRMRQAALKAF